MRIWYEKQSYLRTIPFTPCQVVRLSVALDESASFASRVAAPQVIKLNSKKGKAVQDPRNSGALGVDRLEELSLDGVEQFLLKHKTAKIIVVVDTHCMEDSGDFVYRGGGKQQLGICTLHQVRLMIQR